MALVRAMNAAISGLRADQFRIDTIGDNLANSTTTGFKTGRARFETILSQTLSHGSAPQGFLGGIDPVQLGLGVKVGDTSRDFSQGAIEATGVASDFAIEGEGFFTLVDETGSRVYTRDGSFTVSPSNLLHNPSNGYIVQGFMADLSTFQIQNGGPVGNIRVPLGDLRVARATSTAAFDGNLSGGGDLAASGTVLETEQFLSGGIAATLNSTLAGLQRQTASGPVSLGIVDGSVIEVTADKGGRMLPVRRFAVSATAIPGTDDFGTTLGDFVDFLNDGLGINRVSSSSYSMVARRVTPAGTTVFAAGSVQAGETLAAIPAGTPLFSYTALETVDFRALGAEEGDFIRFTSGAGAGQIAQITFIDSADANGDAVVDGTNNRLTLSGIDTTLPLPGAGAAWEINEYSRVSLGYRPSGSGAVNLANPGEAVTTSSYIRPGTDFADPDGNGVPDVTPGDTIAFDTGGRLVQAVIQSIGTTFTPNDTLTFTPATNIPAAALAGIGDATPWSVNGTPLFGELLATDTVTTTTLTRPGKDWRAAGVAPGAFVRFQTPVGSVVTSVGSVSESVTGSGVFDRVTFASTLAAAPAAGSFFRIDGKMDAQTASGRIRIDGNIGEANRLSNLRMQVVNGLNLTTLSEVASAAGESVVTNATIFDSLGTPRVVELTFALQSKSDRGVRFTYFAEADDDVDFARAVGTGFVDFNPDGTFRAQSPISPIAIDLTGSGAVTPLVVNPDFTSVTGFTDQASEVALTDQDGFAEGTLTDFAVGTDGIITGIFSNGQTRNIAQLVLSRFNNPNGLTALGSNLFKDAANSGLAVTGTPGSFGRGRIRSGFLEESNVDIAKQFTDLIVAQRSFQANARTIRVTDELLQDLVNIL